MKINWKFLVLWTGGIVVLENVLGIVGWGKCLQFSFGLLMLFVAWEATTND